MEDKIANLVYYINNKYGLALTSIYIIFIYLTIQPVRVIFVLISVLEFHYEDKKHRK